VTMMKELRRDAKATSRRRLADLVEIGSDGTSIGKTTIANRLAHLYREAGRRVTLVRIESSRRRKAGTTGAADVEVFIETEEFATAAGRTGGLTGVLTPLWEAILRIPETGEAVIVDWAGGTVAHRLDVIAATGFDATLAALGVRGLSLVVTTCAAEAMSQAGAYLSGLAKVAPALSRALVLSGRAGPFDFAAGSEQAESFERLKRTAGAIPMVQIQFVRGRALEVCADAGLEVAAALMTEALPLSRRLGVDVFRASSCASELALWWQRSGAALGKVLETVDGSPA
jgi:hypothetical protein